MARPATITREAVLDAAIRIVRRDGEESLSSRNIAKEIGCSSRPIYTLYENMDGLLQDVRRSAIAIFQDKVADCLDYVPAFKEYGIRLVKFGVEEYNLFRMIFLSRDLKQEDFGEVLHACRNAFINEYYVSSDHADMLISLVWTYVCGLATLIHTGAVQMTDEQISDSLSDEFVGILTFLKSGRNVHGLTTRKREGDSITLEI